MEKYEVVFEGEISPKGIKTFKLYLDDIDLIETGTEVKDGKTVIYYKFEVHD